jgi:hypothetical protein
LSADPEKRQRSVAEFRAQLAGEHGAPLLVPTAA